MKSFRYALAGILHTLKTERNLRIHCSVAVLVLFFAWYGEVSARHVPILFVCIGSVLTAELFNTAFERLCDLVHPEQHPAVKVIKDVSAGAVLVSAIASATAGLWIFLSPAVLFTVLSKFSEAPYVPVILVVFTVFLFYFCKGKKK